MTKLLRRPPVAPSDITPRLLERMKSGTICREYDCKLTDKYKLTIITCAIGESSEYMNGGACIRRECALVSLSLHGTQTLRRTQATVES